MSQTTDLNQNNILLSTPGDFKTQLDSETAAIQAVTLKIEPLEGRQRRVFAQIQIPYSLEQVWQVLTDYEAFSQFMPSLAQSRRLQHPAGGVRVEQIRTKRFMGMNFLSRAVFDIEEKFPNEIYYRLIEGDLKAFSGCWRLDQENTGVSLTYNFSMSPKRIFPMALVENILSHDVPITLLAIRQRVEALFGSR